MTDVQTGKVATEVLVKGTPNVNVGQLSASILVRGNPSVKLGKMALYILYPFSGGPPPAPSRRVACVIT